MSDHKEYNDVFVEGLQWMWGDGFLSPGGVDEVAEILQDVDLSGLHVLDIGCGLGGADRHLVTGLGAHHVTGIDIEESLLVRARQLNGDADVTEQITLTLVEPGPLPFPDNAFDVVFSKDSMVHIADKKACYTEIRRVLRPDGTLAFGDWFGTEDAVTAEMTRWLAVVNLDFSLGTLHEAKQILKEVGFSQITGIDRNSWYLAYMQQELASISGDNAARLSAHIGETAAKQRIESSLLKYTVVEQGQLRPGHVQAINTK